MHGPTGASLDAEVVAVEDVVGRDIIEPARGGLITPGQDPPDHEIDDQPADGTEELADLHDLARLVRLLDHRVLAVRLHRRTRRRPDEVGPPDPRVPVIPQTGVNILLISSRTRLSQPGREDSGVLGDEPDGRKRERRTPDPSAIPHLCLNRPASIDDESGANDC